MTDANRKPKRAGAARLAARVALIAAIIFVLLTGSAYAVGLYVSSPEQAWKTAQREIQKMKDMGILSQEVQIDGKAERIIELPEKKGSDYYFGRLFKRSYAVAAQGGDRKYYFHLSIDMETGKITRLSVEAKADENDVPVGESEWWNGEKTEKTYIYANYDDIVPADLTVDELCTLLEEYWGFTGYTLSGTKDGNYGYDTAVPSGDMLVSELGDAPYLTVYFDGDQSGVPMFIELGAYASNPGRVYVLIGTNHTVG